MATNFRSPSYWQQETHPTPLCKPLGLNQPSVATFRAPVASACRSGRMAVMHTVPPTTTTAAGVLLASTSVLMLNVGLHANSAQEYTAMLEQQVRPLLEALALAPSRLLLWRETTPQHFISASGSGLYAERLTSDEPLLQRSCGAITNVTRANWRNEHFRAWMGARWPASVTRRVLTVPAFAFLLERADLHAPPDCTHLLYSPFAWAPIWDAASAALARGSDWNP